MITGQNISAYEEVASLRANLHHPVELHSYTNKVAQFMAESELIVTKPGALTCTEALTMHLPMVLVNALPGQERANAEHLKKQGCAVWVNRGQLAETVQELLTHPERRAVMAQNCGDVSTSSSGKIVDILYGMVEKRQEAVGKGV